MKLDGLLIGPRRQKAFNGTGAGGGGEVHPPGPEDNERNDDGNDDAENECGEDFRIEEGFCF